MLVSPRLCIASRLLCLKVLVKSPTSSMFAHNGISGLHIEYNGDDLTAHILLGDFYSFNVSQNSSTHFTRTNYEISYLYTVYVISTFSRNTIKLLFYPVRSSRSGNGCLFGTSSPRKLNL